MYYRTTTYEFDPQEFDNMMAYVDQVKDQVNDIEGLNFAHVCIISKTSGVIIAQYESEQAMEKGQKYLWKLMGGIPQFFTSAPVPVGAEVIWKSDS